MPPLPISSKNVWSSVLQEQILTAEVSSFNMQQKLSADRDVESYDYTRAKDDDRPDLVPDKTNIVYEDDLFGEVIDLEEAAFEKQKTLKRKHVAERLGKRKKSKDRLDLPKVTDNSSVEEVTYYISTLLEESKVHLIRRVVNVIGRTKALEMFRMTEDVEAAGGMMIMNGQRRRTKGGVYLTLLKTKSDIPKEQLDEIFVEEQEMLLEKKKKKKRARARKRAEEKKAERAVAQGEKSSTAPASMEVVGEEESNSRFSIEGQRGSPRHLTDHLSDTQGSPVGQDLEGKKSDSSDPEVVDDFDEQLSREMERQAKKAKERKPAACEIGREEEAAGDGITLDDVLDLGVDDDYIE